MVRGPEIDQGTEGVVDVMIETGAKTETEMTGEGIEGMIIVETEDETIVSIETWTDLTRDIENEIAKETVTTDELGVGVQIGNEADTTTPIETDDDKNGLSSHETHSMSNRRSRE